MKNQYGLTRSIPIEIKRQVRKKCGYGCVICGAAIIEYEHVRPEFSKARAHTAEGITLLCPTCRSKKTRGFLSSKIVLSAMENPKAVRDGFAISNLEAGNKHPYVTVGGMTLRNCTTPIQVSGVPLIEIESAEVANGPFQLSASFFDQVGLPSLFIRQNEWMVSSNVWDAEVTGGRITVRSGPGEIALQLLVDPGEGVVIERLKMFCGGYLFEAKIDQFDFVSPGGGRSSIVGCLVDNCNVGMMLD